MSATKQISTRIQVKPQPSGKIGRAERTRAAILNSAVDSLWTHPFRDLTVGSLMSGTDVGRSSFYQHFQDLHELMEVLLDILREETLSVTGAWFEGVGDPVVLLKESLGGLVEVCYHRGPILRAIDDAAATDKRLENAWHEFKRQFDDAVSSRIEADQRQGLISEFAARPVAIALNRLDAYTLIDAFGQRPRSKREPVREALTRIWISTLYGSECLENDSSGLIRE